MVEEHCSRIPARSLRRDVIMWRTIKWSHLFEGRTGLFFKALQKPLTAPHVTKLVLPKWKCLASSLALQEASILLPPAPRTNSTCLVANSDQAAMLECTALKCRRFLNSVLASVAYSDKMFVGSYAYFRSFICETVTSLCQWRCW